MILLPLLLGLSVTFPFSMPAAVAPHPHGWSLVPIGFSADGFSGVEVLFAAPTPFLPKVLLGRDELEATYDSSSAYLRAAFPSRFPGDTVLVLTTTPILQAAFEAPLDGALRLRPPPRREVPLQYLHKPVIPEPSRGLRSLLWSFEEGLPSPWTSDAILLDSLPLVLTVSGREGLHTVRTWAGIRASSHPVLVVSMRANSSVGHATLSWTNSRGQTDSLQAAVHPRADWWQFVLRPYRCPTWRDRITSLRLVPLSHPGLVALTWIHAPALPQPWEVLLSRGWVPWAEAALLALALTLLWSIRGFSPEVAPAAFVAAATLCVMILPFPELAPSIRLGGLVVPFHALASAPLAAWAMRRPTPLTIASLACASIVLLHGLLVAGGAGLQDAVHLACVPLVLVAGSALCPRSRTRVLSVIGCVALALGAHALLFPSPREDPLFGPVLMTLGRSFWDTTSAGRTAGAFVHPLVLSTVAAVVGAATVAAARSKRNLVMGCCLVAVGFGGLSRTFLVLVVLGVGWTLRGRPRLFLAVTALLLALVAVLARGSQGVTRGLHAERRMVGLTVTASALTNKPAQGVGWGRYERAVRRFGPPLTRVRSYTTPDNSYLRLLAEGGLLGGGAFLAWMALVGCAIAKAPTGRWLPPPFAFIALAVMWAVFDAAYWTTSSVVPSLCLGLLIDEGTSHAVPTH